MKRVSIFLFSILSLVAVLPAAAGDKVEICHFSPGGTVSTVMTVGMEAAVWHISKHGDHVGGCLFGGDPPSSMVYVTDFSTNEVFVLNGGSNTQIDTLQTKKNPYRAVASPNGEFVFIPNFNSSSVSVVSTSENVIGVVTVGSGPQNVVFTPDSAMAYVYNVRAGTVSVVRTSDLTVTDTITVGTGNSFVDYNNLAISPDGAFVYVPNTNDNTVSVIETASNQVRATVRVGKLPFALAVTPDSQYVYVVNGESPLSVIQTSDHTVIKSVAVPLNSQSLAITPDGQYVYIIGNSQFVQVISTATISVVAQIELDQANYSTDIVIDPDSSHVYVPSAQTFIGNGALHVIDTASHSVTARVPLGGAPKYAAISPDGAKVYIANFVTLDVVQTSDNSVVKVNTGGQDAYGVAVVDIP